MRRISAHIARHMETMIVITVLLGSTLGVYLVEEKTILLNFYYVPVLVTGYFLGKKHAVLAAIFCVLATIFYTVLYPNMFESSSKSVLRTVSSLLAWGGFLILVTIVASHLFELNKQRVQELRQAYVGVLEILTKFLEDKDRDTKGHSLRVAELARDMAKEMHLREEDVEVTRVAALLHDIGKVDVSTSVINKAARLDEQERRDMAAHPVKGAALLKSVGVVLKGAVPLVEAHHRYFAHGLNSAEIPLGARIIAVADAFDSMTSDRPYRKAMPIWDALAELKRNAGAQFDPDVVKAFEQIVSERVEKM